MFHHEKVAVAHCYSPAFCFLLVLQSLDRFLTLTYDSWVSFDAEKWPKHWCQLCTNARVLSSISQLPRTKLWKSENGPNSWNELNILTGFVYTFILTNAILNRQSPTLVQIFCVACKWNWPQGILCFEHILYTYWWLLCTYWCWLDLAQQMAKCHFHSFRQSQNFYLSLVQIVKM